MKMKREDYMQIALVSSIIAAAVLLIVFVVLPSDNSMLARFDSVVDQDVNGMKSNFPTSTFKSIDKNEASLGTVKILLPYNEFIEKSPDPNYIMYDTYEIVGFLRITGCIKFYMVSDGIVYWCEIEIEVSR